MATDTDNTVNKIFQYKLVLLGESSVGKSSLVLRFVKGQFLDFQESTIGGEFSFSSPLFSLTLFPRSHSSFCSCVLTVFPFFYSCVPDTDCLPQ